MQASLKEQAVLSKQGGIFMKSEKRAGSVKRAALSNYGESSRNEFKKHAL